MHDRVQPVRGAEVVDAGHRHAQLEPQRRVVPQDPAHVDEVVGQHLQGQLAAVHDHRGHRVLEVRVRRDQRVRDLVEALAVRALGRDRGPGPADQAAETGGVAGPVRAEGAAPDDAGGGLAGRGPALVGQRPGAVRPGVGLSHVTSRT